MTHEAIEARFIAAVIKDDTGERWIESRGIPLDAFRDPRCARAWEHAAAAESFEAACLGPARAFFANPATGLDYPQDRWILVTSLLQERGPKFLPELAQFVGTGKSKLRARLETRKFNLAMPPAEPVPRYLINGKPICTPGNLTNIIAQAKAGKSALISAMIAARICAGNQDDQRDTLGVTAGIAPGRLIHIDTEQSPYDHHQLVLRSMRRAGVLEAPSWLDSFALAGFSAQELRVTLHVLLAGSETEGVFAAILDGTADMAADVNDPGECNQFVAELHDLAIKHDCPIIGVMHENPGQDGGKMRGHLGSQLERKAESNLRLKKVDEITVIYSEKMRKSPILVTEGPRFVWSNEDGMHVSIANKATVKDNEKLADLRDLAEEVFSTGTLRYADACKKIEDARRIGSKAAEKWFTLMKKHRVISKAPLGLWEFKAS